MVRGEKADESCVRYLFLKIVSDKLEGRKRNSAFWDFWDSSYQ